MAQVDGKAIATLEIKEDGVYLTAKDLAAGDKVSRNQVLQLIETSALADVDYTAVNDFFKQTGSNIEMKISNNKSIVQKDEEAEVTLSKDAMGAFITFYAPICSGKKLTLEQIRKKLNDAEVKFGINEDTLEALANYHDYQKSYTIAVGQQPQSGVDGYLKFHFDGQERSNKPKVLEDGRVDYRQVDFFESVLRGQLLVEAVLPVEGVDGINVLNQPVSHKAGKPAPKMPKGKNVHTSEDGLQLLASISGQLIYVDKKVSVSPVLEIASDVGNATGNIDFLGSVIVKGNVMTGFSIRATGNVEVHGIVEGGAIHSNANVYLYSGIQGAEKAIITADGDLFAKFAQNCTLIAKGDISSDSIMHCQVKCDGSILLEGKKCLLVGGSISAGKDIKASTIGSTMATATEISAGNSPEFLEQFTALKTTLNETQAEYHKTSQVAETLLKFSKAKDLSVEKKDLLLKTLHTKAFLRDKIVDLEAQISLLLESSNEQSGAVYVSEVIRPGVKVLIGNAMMYVRDDIYACILRNIDGKIVIGPK